MRILITGSRNWPDKEKVAYEIEQAIEEIVSSGAVDVDGGVTVIHGACEFGGADTMAAEWALHQGYAIQAHPVGEKSKATHGNRAYYLRNKAMVDSGADVCLAFVYGSSRGTRMTMKLASEAGIPVKEFHL